MKALRSFGTAGRTHPTTRRRNADGLRLKLQAVSCAVSRDCRLWSAAIRRSVASRSGRTSWSNNTGGSELHRRLLLCPQAGSANRGDPLLYTFLIAIYVTRRACFNRCTPWPSMHNPYTNSYIFWHSGAIFRKLL